MPDRRAQPPARSLDLGRGCWAQLIAGFVPEHEVLMEAFVAALPLRQEPIIVAFARRLRHPRASSCHPVARVGPGAE